MCFASLGRGTATYISFFFVLEMEACLREVNNGIPAREVICALAEKFSASPDRTGKVTVNPKQVWNWFQNRRYAQRTRLIKAPGKLSVSPLPRGEEAAAARNVSNSAPVTSGRHAQDGPQLEFEARSARDGAWYDVAAFISHRMFETNDPEVRVRFSGFGSEEDEWVNVKKCVRLRSLPCETAECVVVLPGDLILCFQEGKEQALYFDAHVLDAQRRRHDVRGCRCRFLVRYDHDQSEQEIVPLRKICRRPETDYRLQLLYASKELSSVDLRSTPHLGKEAAIVNPNQELKSADQKIGKQPPLDPNTNTVIALGALTSQSVNSLAMIQKNPSVIPVMAKEGSATAATETDPAVNPVNVEKSMAITDVNMGALASASGDAQ
ncbi:protein SAWADEE HOMEODOMAIN HOMOLOG 2 isoform X2 [Amborella trichopoda]|uniref:protein SAWADEE HOMEODOMAIN HOMOLOG 2 isoform X2 n=1 Tax=Amborella trichopoda TaxID=13333 RepID=UPI0009C16FD3|nr:protein SAWADEE HOMEODOMAIN HOMOLOG 2 isoform X2 [Amborella trichopoda]|eukprot:XP_020523597.1 protein SAWADEE HOMEODOMAIN HOMOLOG 2 isoform X2 [Amborella trichopoda]